MPQVWWRGVRAAHPVMPKESFHLRLDSQDFVRLQTTRCPGYILYGHLHGKQIAHYQFGDSSQTETAD